MDVKVEKPTVVDSSAAINSNVGAKVDADTPAAITSNEDVKVEKPTAVDSPAAINSNVDVKVDADTPAAITSTEDVKVKKPAINPAAINSNVDVKVEKPTVIVCDTSDVNLEFTQLQINYERLPVNTWAKKSLFRSFTGL